MSQQQSPPFIRPESIQIINESLSLPAIDDAVATIIAAHCHQQLRHVLGTASKLLRHTYTQPNIVTCDTLHLALKTLNEPPLLTHAATGANADNGTSAIKPVSDELYFTNDPVIDFESLLVTPLPSLPVAASLSVHWLAIEGVQPRIPQNPSPSATSALSVSDDKTIIVPTNNATIVTTASTATVTGSVPESASYIALKPLLNSVLSKEQKLYFQRAIDTVTNANTSTMLRLRVIDTLINDSGMQQLLPYFVYYINYNIATQLRNHSLIKTLLLLLTKLLESKKLNLEFYLHQLLPSLLTIILNRVNYDDSHQLRLEAAQCVVVIVDGYNAFYQKLKSRVIRTLLTAFTDIERSLNTHYGALLTLSMLGASVVETMVMPYVKQYLTLLAPLLTVTETNINMATSTEANSVYQLLIQIAGQYLYHSLLSSEALLLIRAEQSLALRQRASNEPSLSSLANESLARIDEEKKKRRKELATKIQRSKKRKNIEEPVSAPAPAGDSSLASSLSIDFPLSDLSELFGDSLQPYIQCAMEQFERSLYSHYQLHYIGQMFL